MLISGSIIALITFPGVIFHEIAHRFFADLVGIPVYEICYFRRGNPAGYVIHGRAQGLRDAFLISIGPLILNTILCAILTFAAVFPILILKADSYNPIFLLLFWAGISIGMNAFPSKEDIANFLEETKNAERTPLLVVSKGFAVLLSLANALSAAWFDVLYAFGVSMLLPWIFGLV